MIFRLLFYGKQWHNVALNVGKIAKNKQLTPFPSPVDEFFISGFFQCHKLPEKQGIVNSNMKSSDNVVVALLISF